MYIKENTNEKVNFIDENDVFLGYDIGQHCCEYADYFLTSNPEVVNCSVQLLKEIENAGDQFLDAMNIRLDGYVFDTTFYDVVSIDETMDGYDDETNIVYFKCVKEGAEDLFIVLMNTHNGYYYHGFDFKSGGDSIISEQI